MSCYPDSMSLADIRRMEGEDPETEYVYDPRQLRKTLRQQRRNHPTTNGETK